jgi:hypothetical protein
VTSVREQADKKYRCDGCGTRGIGAPTVTGRGVSGTPIGRWGGSMSTTWTYAWLCDECRAPFLKASPPLQP